MIQEIIVKWKDEEAVQNLEKYMCSSIQQLPDLGEKLNLSEFAYLKMEVIILGINI